MTTLQNVKDDNTVSNVKIQGEKYRAVTFSTCLIFVIKAVPIQIFLKRCMYGLANLN